MAVHYKYNGIVSTEYSCHQYKAILVHHRFVLFVHVNGADNAIMSTALYYRLWLQNQSRHITTSYHRLLKYTARTTNNRTHILQQICPKPEQTRSAMPETASRTVAGPVVREHHQAARHQEEATPPCHRRSQLL